jgi:hypothetical protein
MGPDEAAIQLNSMSATNRNCDQQPIELTALEVEQVTQDAKKQVRSIGTDDLRLLRAYLLDVISKRLSQYTAAAQIRGRVAHEEIERRERNLVARLVRPSTLRWSLERLARFPDLEAPEALREKKGGS